MQKGERGDELAGSHAHDLNNQLAVVISSLKLLQLHLTRGDTDVQRFLDAARQGAERAAGLTRSLGQSKNPPLILHFRARGFWSWKMSR